MSTGPVVVVLAAGAGRRLSGDGADALPKVLHLLAGVPMLDHVCREAAALEPARLVVVTAPHAQERLLERARRFCPHSVAAVQQTPDGTGAAVQVARDLLAQNPQDSAGLLQGNWLILNGDNPLVMARTLAGMLEQLEAGADFVVSGFRPADPGSYGRLVLDDAERPVAIREVWEEATAHESGWVNAGALAFRGAQVLPLLDRLDRDNARGEAYLTDLVGLAHRAGLTGRMASWTQDEAVGVNDARDWSQAGQILQRRLRDHWQAAGVFVEDPASTWFSADAQIAPGVRIEPHVWIGPGVQLAEQVVVRWCSHLEGVEIAPGTVVGPFARLRPGTRIGRGVRIGNFVELKAACVGDHSRINHLSYVGDAWLGAGVNVGAGVITCNFDGVRKARTEIGAGAFVGSNSSLVAPVEIGAGAFVGAGSVITRPVAEGSLALGRARQVEKRRKSSDTV